MISLYVAAMHRTIRLYNFVESKKPMGMRLGALNRGLEQVRQCHLSNKVANWHVLVKNRPMHFCITFNQMPLAWLTFTALNWRQRLYVLGANGTLDEGALAK